MQTQEPKKIEAGVTVPQTQFLQLKAKFPAFVAGYGTGKTYVGAYRAIALLLANPGTNHGFYEPTTDLIIQVAHPVFEEVLSDLNIPYRLYSSPLINKIKIPRVGNIIFRSMDKPQRIVGFKHADATVDEIDTLDIDKAKMVWRKILARNRQNKRGGAVNTIGATTTPEGYGFMYDRWVKRGNEDYQIIHAHTNTNPFLPEDFIINLENDYPLHLLKAYLEGQFVNLTSGSVYPDFDRKLNGTTAKVLPEDKALHIGMDFNVRKMAATAHVIRDGIPYGVDEFMGLRDTPAMVGAIKEKYPDKIIVIYPDASGGGTNTTDASTSDLIIIKEAGFKIQANKANPRVKDRVNSLNAMICNSKGNRRYFINEEMCPCSVEALEQQVYDKNGAPDKTNDKDHPCDEIGYFVIQRWPIVKLTTRSRPLDL